MKVYPLERCYHVHTPGGIYGVCADSKQDARNLVRERMEIDGDTPEIGKVEYMGRVRWGHGTVISYGFPAGWAT